MKFFAATLLVVLLAGASIESASPKQRLLGLNLDGLLGGVANTVSGLVQTVGNVLANVSTLVRNILNKLPRPTSRVLAIVNNLIRETGQTLLCTVQGVLNGVLHFTAKLTDGVVDIGINLATLDILKNGEIIGKLLENGSICDSEGNIIGVLDPLKGVIVIVGKAVEELLCNVNELLSGLLQSLDELLGGILEAVQEAAENLTPELKEILGHLPVLTSEIVETVKNLLDDTGKGLVCTLQSAVDNILRFDGVGSGEGFTCFLNELTNEITNAAGELICTLGLDGSLVDLLGNVIGCLDSVTGCLIFTGEGTPQA
jgi:phage-related protein